MQSPKKNNVQKWILNTNCWYFYFNPYSTDDFMISFHHAFNLSSLGISNISVGYLNKTSIIFVSNSVKSIQFSFIIQFFVISNFSNRIIGFAGIILVKFEQRIIKNGFICDFKHSCRDYVNRSWMPWVNLTKIELFFVQKFRWNWKKNVLSSIFFSFPKILVKY